MNVVGELCLPLASKMWAIHKGSDDAPRLIFPFYRSDAVRVSEQESKILLCLVLETTAYNYSIETPTREMYVQSGNNPLSARIDVTVYGSRVASDRILNVELKSGAATLEAFRKDFEKLVREGVPGLWFHTIDRVNSGTVRLLLTRMAEAMALVADHAASANHSITLALCLLEREVLLTAEMQFGADLEAQLIELLGTAATGWEIHGPGRAEYGSAAISRATGPRRSLDRFSRPTRASSSEPRTTAKLLIYCPAITDDSLLHFSRVGDSYRLRAFAGRLAGRPAWMESGIVSATEFLKTYEPQLMIDVRDQRVSIDQSEQWASIVMHANRDAGIQ